MRKGGVGLRNMNLIVYGSLMKTAERVRTGFSPSAAVPVTVDGFVRLFDQLPTWRRGEGSSVALLSVERARGRRMNAVLLLDVSDSLASADHRERGYRRRRVNDE